MNYKTVEVELENGRVRPSGPELLPAKARALLTLLDYSPPVAPTCRELANRWGAMDKLSPSEANAFADDLEQGRASLPALKSAWD